jgi:dihydroorotate dehydrogenase (NAD+) catalytic subunit
LKLDPSTLRPVLGPGFGGLSGPALKPIALAAVSTCYAATGMPIVGMGGVATGQDALELIAVGARHVALGTVLFADPDAPARIRAELHRALAERGWSSYEDAYARAHEEPLSVGTTVDSSWGV